MTTSVLFPGGAHLGTYRIVVADPPWAHENYGQAKHGAAKSNYPEMSIEDMSRMPVGDLAHPDGALLLLWCTGPQAAQGAHHRLAEAWGFTLRARPFAWVKTNARCAACDHLWIDHDEGGSPDVGQRAGGPCGAGGVHGCDCQAFAVAADFGPGSYTGGNIEDVWLGVRGDATWSSDRARRDVRQVIFAPAADRHSEKPEAMQDRVEALWPDATPRLELFARRRRTGWACWGGECPEPDLVFGADIGPWWPVTAKPVAATADPQAMLW